MPLSSDGDWGAEAAPPAAGDHGHLWPHDWLAMPAMSLVALAPSLSDSLRTHISIFQRLRFSVDVTSTVIPQVQSSSSTIGKGPKGGQTNLAASRGLQRLGSELRKSKGPENGVYGVVWYASPSALSCAQCAGWS